MPTRWTPAPRPLGAALLLILLLDLSVAPSPRALAQQQPVAVVAVSGLDPLLEDIDHLFAAGEAPQHARKARDVIAALNGLQGLDRSRPLGAYLFYPAGGEKEPQPLLFFPVADIARLQTSLQIGDDLRLLPGETGDRLILHTDDGDFPVKLQNDFAFLDPTKSGVRFEQPLPDPMDLLGSALDGQDAALIIRREGLPPALIELAIGHLRTEALKDQSQREGEKDAEYALRLEVHKAVFSLLESAVREWQGATLRWRLSAEDRTAHVDASLALDPAGRTVTFLRSIRGDSDRFAPQLAREDAAISLGLSWQPTPAGRALLERVVGMLREQMTAEVAHADASLQEAVFGVVDALETTVTEESFDSFLRLQKRPEGGEEGFVLLGGTSVADAQKVAVGLDRLLPFAADSPDVRSVETSVARAQEVAIHCLHPQQLRKRDRRLYGDDAAIYLAAGRGALWVALGGPGTASQLADAILMGDQAADASASPTDTEAHGASEADGSVFLDVRVHAFDWVGLAREDAEGPDARIAALAHRAFDTRQDDRLRLWLQPADDGLHAHLHLEHGYVRLLALALAERLSRP